MNKLSRKAYISVGGAISTLVITATIILIANQIYQGQMIALLDFKEDIFNDQYGLERIKEEEKLYSVFYNDLAYGERVGLEVEDKVYSVALGQDLDQLHFLRPDEISHEKDQRRDHYGFVRDLAYEIDHRGFRASFKNRDLDFGLYLVEDIIPFYNISMSNRKLWDFIYHSQSGSNQKIESGDLPKGLYELILTPVHKKGSSMEEGPALKILSSDYIRQRKIYEGNINGSEKYKNIQSTVYFIGHMGEEELKDYNFFRNQEEKLRYGRYKLSMEMRTDKRNQFVNGIMGELKDNLRPEERQEIRDRLEEALEISSWNLNLEEARESLRTKEIKNQETGEILVLRLTGSSLGQENKEYRPRILKTYLHRGSK